MRNKSLLIIVGAFALTGCSSSRTHVVERTVLTRPYYEINQNGKNKQVEVILKNSESVTGKNIMFRADSTFWTTSEGRRKGVATKEVKTITFVRRHTLAGFARGLIGGAALGFIFGYVGGDDCSSNESFCLFPRDEMAVQAAVVFGGLGALVGAVVGSKSTTTDTYTFSEEPKATSQKN